MTILITGATSGLGLATARVLTASGQEVAIASRTKRTVDETTAALGPLASGYVCDLTSVESVQKLVASLKGQKVTKVVLCAGMNSMTVSKVRVGETEVDTVFAANHVGHFLLTYLLLTTGDHPELSNIVIVSSGVHLPDHDLARAAGVKVPHFESAAQAANVGSHDPTEAYPTSKLCNVLFGYALARRYPRLTVSMVDPGLMTDTELLRELNPLVRFLATSLIVPLAKLYYGHKIRHSSVSGADLAILLGRTGPPAYFDGHEQTPCSPQGRDEEAQEDLWSFTKELLQLE
jgi:NAD(P)-dependent dehydrogenase (short-subunit alcohol dehydrogenase family)